jgi:hypothetical protein
MDKQEGRTGRPEIAVRINLQDRLEIERLAKTRRFPAGVRSSGQRSEKRSRVGEQRNKRSSQPRLSHESRGFFSTGRDAGEPTRVHGRCQAGTSGEHVISRDIRACPASESGPHVHVHPVAPHPRRRTPLSLAHQLMRPVAVKGLRFAR